MKRKLILEVFADLMNAVSITEVNAIKSANVVHFDKYPILFRHSLNAQQRIRRVENEKRLSWSNQIN